MKNKMVFTLWALVVIWSVFIFGFWLATTDKLLQDRPNIWLGYVLFTAIFIMAGSRCVYDYMTLGRDGVPILPRDIPTGTILQIVDDFRGKRVRDVVEVKIISEDKPTERFIPLTGTKRIGPVRKAKLTQLGEKEGTILIVRHSGSGNRFQTYIGGQESNVLCYE